MKCCVIHHMVVSLYKMTCERSSLMSQRLYSHFSFKGKALAGMEMYAASIDVEWHQLHYLFEVRMIESEYIALNNFMIDYPVIIGYLAGEIKELEGSSNAAVQCKVIQMKHWSRRMREFKFVAVTLCLLDNDKRSKIFSKAAQNDNSTSMASAMLETFDERLPVPEVLLHLREVFDFRRMPWHDSTALETWSNQSIVWLVVNKFPELDAETLQTQALKVRMWLREDLGSFYKDVPLYNSDGDAIKGQSKKQLALCGADSAHL